MIDIKIVTKPWGNEQWIADGVRTPYALKRILFKAGNRTSLQVHERKVETNYVLAGTGKLYRSHNKFDVDKFLVTGMTAQAVAEYEATFETINLLPGVIFDVMPGFVHRVQAITDLTFMEVSTCDLDDVIRLQDDSGRAHGKIQSEHGE
jgi:quercetin dioxygenase-like cupin family protein